VYAGLDDRDFSRDYTPVPRRRRVYLLIRGVSWQAGLAAHQIRRPSNVHEVKALNGGPHDKFNDAISLSVACKDQAEVDRLWDALTADGGTPVQCGWLKDKFGVSWQIVPEEFVTMMRDPDPKKSKSAMEAMVKMVKLDLAKLKRAFEA
jgi:hypothetical protein